MKKNITYYLAGSVALATFLVYLPALNNEFVNWDDSSYILENVHIRSLNAAFFKWAFFDFYASNWHPLTWISHALDYALWGLNPLGHHLTNIIFHAVNTFLVVLLIRRLLDASKERTTGSGHPAFLNERTMLIAAGATGLLFGLHPVHVESVAWVAERKDLLCALFFMLSIMMYVQSAQRTGQRAEGVVSKTATPGAMRYAVFADRRYLAAVGFFLLALLSKPMAVSLPVVLLILDWYPLDRIRSIKAFLLALIEKLPFIVLSLISSVLTILAQRAGSAIVPTELIPLSIRPVFAVNSLIAYLWKMVWPLNLIPFYPHPQMISYLSLKNLSAVALAIGITCAGMALAKKKKMWLTVVWCYYIATLIPVLGIVQVGGQAMADRYTYLPSIGPFLVMALAAAWIADKLPALTRRGTLIKAFSTSAAILVAVVLSYLSVKQIGIWKTSFDLWSYVIEKEPGRVPLAYNYRGAAFYKEGRFEEAIQDFDRAIALNPSYVEAYNNRGIAFDDNGRLDRAIEDFERAIALNPSYYKAYNNRGALYGKVGQLDKAIESFTISIVLNPGYVDAYINRGTAYSFAGQYGMAMDDFNKAILLDPNNAVIYVNRGKLHLMTGNRELAVADFQKACESGNKDGCNALQ